MKAITQIIKRARLAIPRASLAAAVLQAGAAPLAGQSPWTGLERPQGFQLELHHPELAGGAFGALTGVGFAGARFANVRTTRPRRRPAFRLRRSGRRFRPRDRFAVATLPF